MLGVCYIETIRPTPCDRPYSFFLSAVAAISSADARTNARLRRAFQNTNGASEEIEIGGVIGRIDDLGAVRGTEVVQTKITDGEADRVRECDEPAGASQRPQGDAVTRTRKQSWSATSVGRCEAPATGGQDHIDIDDDVAVGLGFALFDRLPAARTEWPIRNRPAASRLSISAFSPSVGFRLDLVGDRSPARVRFFR